MKLSGRKGDGGRGQENGGKRTRSMLSVSVCIHRHTKHLWTSACRNLFFPACQATSQCSLDQLFLIGDLDSQPDIQWSCLSPLCIFPFVCCRVQPICIHSSNPALFGMTLLLLALPVLSPASNFFHYYNVTT